MLSHSDLSVLLTIIHRPGYRPVTSGTNRRYPGPISANTANIEYSSFYFFQDSV